MKMSKQAKKMLLNVLFLLILVAVTLIILILSNRELNFENIASFLKSCNPWWLLAAFGAMALSVVFEAVSLFFILRGLGEKPKISGSLVYATADLYYSAITPSASGGQPASAFYMVRDKIAAGKASFALVFNLVAYTLAIILIGAVVFIIRPAYFGLIENWFVKLLIILGFVLQSLLLLFFIGCMFWGKGVQKCGNGLITLLNKMKLVKKPDKWREKLRVEVEKYSECLHALKEHPGMSFANFFCNLGQRVSHVSIAAFVCLAADPSLNFLDLFALEALVLVGYNSIPLPGGVGAFEYLYLEIYSIYFGGAFILSAMMVSRVLSFYLRMILSGVYTMAYHVHTLRKTKTNLTGDQENGEETKQT